MNQPAPYRQIRALFDADTITVYQAFSPAIADAALDAGRFVPPFKRERMTWIKPSFCWMMYRCGWATASGQERVLAIRLSRAGFEEALSRSVLSHFDPDLHTSREEWAAQIAHSDVRIQWDPERSIDLGPLAWRSLQVGLRGQAMNDYVERWVRGIDDVTALAHGLGTARNRNPALLPVENPYPLPPAVAARIGATTA